MAHTSLTRSRQTATPRNLANGISQRTSGMQKMNSSRTFLFLLTASLFLVMSGCNTSTENDYLEDPGQYLTKNEAEHLIELHKAVQRSFDAHFKLIILPQKSENINDTAVNLFGNLGARTKGAKGLLFLVDPKGEQVRLEVGYDLERYFPDAFISYLETKQMLPFFAAERIGHGIEATSELLVARLQRAMEGNAYDPELELAKMKNYSGGAGAKIALKSEKVAVNRLPAEDINDYSAQPTPEKALEKYKQVLANHIKTPTLGLYTEPTQAFFMQWVVTDAQQDNELKNLLSQQPEKILVSENFAVIRYPTASRTQPPYFLQKNGSGWMFDFQTMSRVIQMNHKNMWHFRKLDHSYMFGFKDWLFDKNGFPLLPQDAQ